jgi:serine O-acetyltransferase
MAGAEVTWWDTVCADVAEAEGRSAPGPTVARLKLLIAGLVKVKSLAVILFRLSQLAGRRSASTGALVKQLNHLLTGADIDHHATVGPGFRLPHPTGVVIGGQTVLGARCIVQTCVTLGDANGSSPQIGDNTIIAPGARIFGAVVIAPDCEIAPNACVTKSVDQPGVLVGGIPAKLLRERTQAEIDRIPATPAR